MNTVSLLKSEAINEIISPKKLTKTKINCKKVKGIIHWLDQKSSVRSVIQNFEGAKKVTYDKAVVEASILNLKKENNCQFERVGYYKINNVNNGSHECYQIVTLKDTSKRKV